LRGPEGLGAKHPEPQAPRQRDEPDHLDQLVKPRHCAAAMLSIKTKKAMKPMLEMLAITDEAGAEQPQPTGERPDEQAKPSDPSRQRPRGQDGTAYSGTTTPQPRKLPAALVTGQ
jgi:hypothetical protein